MLFFTKCLINGKQLVNIFSKKIRKILLVLQKMTPMYSDFKEECHFSPKIGQIDENSNHNIDLWWYTYIRVCKAKKSYHVPKLSRILLQSGLSRDDDLFASTTFFFFIFMSHSGNGYDTSCGTKKILDKNAQNKKILDQIILDLNFHTFGNQRSKRNKEKLQLLFERQWCSTIETILCYLRQILLPFKSSSSLFYSF
jgi:hypothetical protein